MNVVFTVPEISCGHCKDTIESTLNNVESIESVSVDIEKKSVEVISSSDLDMMNVSQLLDEQGYTVVQSCLLYTSPSPRDRQKSRMPSSA